MIIDYVLVSNDVWFIRIGIPWGTYRVCVCVVSSKIAQAGAILSFQVQLTSYTIPEPATLEIEMWIFHIARLFLLKVSSF